MADGAEPPPPSAGQQPPLAVPAHPAFSSLSNSSSAASSPHSLADGALQPVSHANENVAPQYAHIDRHRLAPFGSSAADSSAPSSSSSSGGAISSFYGVEAFVPQPLQLHSSASGGGAQHGMTGGEQGLPPPPPFFTTLGDDGLVPATSSLDVSSASSLNASYENLAGQVTSGSVGDGTALALHESTPYQHSQEMFAHWQNASAQPPTSLSHLAAPVPTHPHTSLFNPAHEGYAQPYQLHANPHDSSRPVAGPSHGLEAMTSAAQSQHHLARYDTHHVNHQGYITAPADYYGPMGYSSSLQSQYAPHFHPSVSPDQRMEQQQLHLPYSNPHNMPAASYLPYEQHGPMHLAGHPAAQSEYPVYHPTAQAPTSYAGERGLPVSYTAADYANMHQNGFSRHAFAQVESHPLPVRPNYLQQPSFEASKTEMRAQNPAFAMASTSAGPSHAFFPANPEQMQAAHNGSSDATMGGGLPGPEQHGINVMVGGQYFSNFQQDPGPLPSPQSRGQSKSVSSYDVQQQSYLGAPQPSPTWTQGSLISPAASNFPQSGTPQAGQGTLSNHDYFGHLPQISPRDLTSEWQPSLLPYQSQMQQYAQDNDLAAYNGPAIPYASGVTVQPTQPPSQQAQPSASTGDANPSAAVRPKRSRANSKKNPKGEENVPTATSGSTDDPTTSTVSSKVLPMARKETRVHDGLCMACGKIFATINLRGHPEDFQNPFTLQYYCLDCAPASLGISRAALQATVGSSLTSVTNSKGQPETSKGSPTASDTSDTSDPDPKSLKVVTKGSKKRMRPTDVSSATVCDVCSRWLAHGAPITEEPGAELGFNIEIVCTLCSDKYRRCSDCGGGGGARLGVGKWRCKELFSPGRKTCDLSHARQSSITSMEYCTTRIRDIPANEREELIAKCKGAFEAALYSSLAVPEVLERGTAMATTYQDVTRRVTEGWDDAVRNLMDDIESIDHVRRYVGLRWSAPRPRKIAGSKKAGKQAEGPSSPNTKSEGAKAVLRSNMNLSGYVSGEWDIYGGTFYITVSVPYSTGEQYEGSAHLIGLLQKRIMQERQEIIDNFKAEAKLMAYLESKRQLIPLDRYVQKYPDTDVTVFPPHRKSYIRSKEQKHWTVLVRRLHLSSTPTPGSLESRKLGQITNKQPKSTSRGPAKVAAAEGA